MKSYRLFTLLMVLLSACAEGVPQRSGVGAESALPTLPTRTPAPAGPSARPPRPSPTPGAPQSNEDSLLSENAPCMLADGQSAASPRNTWSVYTCQGARPQDGTTTRIVGAAGRPSWNLSFMDDYIAHYRLQDARQPPLLNASFVPVAWTPDESYLYLGVRISTFPSPYPGYDALFRLDLATGQLRPTLKPVVGAPRTDYAFSFSPDATRLAYLNQALGPLTLVLHNTLTGADQRLTLDARFSRAGSLLWSPDGAQLVLSAFDPGKNGGCSLILFDLDSLRNEYLVLNSPNTYLPGAWLPDGRLYAKDYYANHAVGIDLATKQISDFPVP